MGWLLSSHTAWGIYSMAAPPRSSDGPLNVQSGSREEPGPSDWTRYDVPYGAPYEHPSTVYGRSATVYGGTVTDSEPDPDSEAEAGEPGFLGFVGTPEPVPGRHSVAAQRMTGRFEAAGLPPVALALAVVAILIGGIATVTGIVAVGRATSAQMAAERAASAAASAMGVAQPTVAVRQPMVPVPTSASPTPPSPSPSPSPTLDPDHLDPRANYELAYDRQFIRVPPSTCEGTDVDLDEPRVLPPAGPDVAYRSCADGFHLDFDESARYAVVAGSGASAGGCADAIRSDPGVGWVEPMRGTTVCVLTSRLAAEPQQLSTKLARLNVEDVEADGTLVAALTAWVVP